MSLEGHLRTSTKDGVVEIEFRLVNRGEDAAELTFNSGQHAEFTVSADDEVIWRWGEGRMFTQAVESDHLEPGEELRYTCTWDEPVPGQYVVEAELLAVNASLAAETVLTV